MGILDYLSRNADTVANGIGGTGEVLMALSQGRAPNMAPYQQRTGQIMERQRMQGLKPGIMGHMQGMNPQQRGILGAMYDANPQAAMGIMAQQAFPSPGDPYARYKVVGSQLVDLGGDHGPEVSIAAPEKPKQLPNEVQQYLFSRQQGDTRTFAEWKKDNKGGVTVNTGMDGVVKLTEGQAKMALFGNMMKSSMPVLDRLEEQFDPANLGDNLAESAGLIGNFLKSDDFKSYKSAANMWLEGVLRLATGAAATQPEIDRLYQTYFAQPGDSAETLAFKRQQRKEAAMAVQEASGGLINPNDPNSAGVTGTQQPAMQFDAEKVVGGKTYVQKSGKWYVKP